MEDGNKLSTGIFGPQRAEKEGGSGAANVAAAASGRKVSFNSTDAKSLTKDKRPASSADSELEKAANQINNMSDTGSEEKMEDANKANKYTEREIELVKESLFRGYCYDTIKGDILGVPIDVEMYSISASEMGLLSQIQFEIGKASLDKDGYGNISQDTLGNLFDAMLCALQIGSVTGFDDLRRYSYGSSLRETKGFIKKHTEAKFPALKPGKNISSPIDGDDKPIETEEEQVLRSIKEYIVTRANIFLNMDSRIFALVGQMRIDFNTMIADLLSENSLVKK